eukprot:CAMPEP_0202897164 /NCGR_PEP_ID=MMETSP1392-20130828/6000_1 /ASSEMBLY_ACC=CAM_ASM_000868 /TAXON_ID=225041 /ORGANISM="Chlamydomonas chlamydogama, Strain SAG 11-48b" /LENGTH=131 /DNA_ID=CAMNT_0049582737 /DNA_START=582 /DNA_END=977 /DNA_ORIENTATION=-
MLSHLKALASWLIPWCSLVIVPAHAFSDADHITRVDVYTDRHVFRLAPPINYFCKASAENDVALLNMEVLIHRWHTLLSVDVPSMGEDLHLAGAVAGCGVFVAPHQAACARYSGMQVPHGVNVGGNTSCAT